VSENDQQPEATGAAEPGAAAASEHAHTNRLIHETSPYLLQHAHNPVDWYPWGPEALERARVEDRPILLSIGYSACHWCHVMAHESFEDEAIAALMNELYVCIKVDREERPDLDALYMQAVQALTGGGGWPMTVFLTPDGAPFFGGTYYPPRDRGGMPGFPTVLRRVADFYRTRGADVERQAEAFREFYREQGELRTQLPAELDLTTAEVEPVVLSDAAQRLLAQIDAVNGGFGRAPKFPHPMALDFMLRVADRLRHGQLAEAAESGLGERLLPLVRLTLDRMAEGGMYDQVGGGFHRYSVDARWLVPHFEKMLYDNALLARTYLAAWQLVGEPRYRQIGEDVLGYVLREMTDLAGGFYSTQDADSEGEEGRFYLWRREELRTALAPDEAKLAERLWGVSEAGNFEGRNILHVARPLAEVAAELGLSEEQARGTVGTIRCKLYGRRAQRVWPGRDDKVIAGWNGLMLRAMADAARALDREDLRRATEANAAFILEHLMTDGRLRRTWRVGQAKGDAYLDDYAAVVNGLLSTYEATADARWYVEARMLMDQLVERFWDEAAGGFFDTARDHEVLIGRPRELTDGATPSGTSLAVEGLLRLAALTGEPGYRERAARALLPLSRPMAEQPSAFSHLLCTLDDFIGPFLEIAIVGPPADTATRELLAVVNRRYLPRSALAAGEPAEPGARQEVPLLADREPIDKRPTAYVCQRFTCQVPTAEPAQLAAQLDALG
jgi:uncharacterized protein YyaL (SSP411 family)